MGFVSWQNKIIIIIIVGNVISNFFMLVLIFIYVVFAVVVIVRNQSILELSPIVIHGNDYLPVFKKFLLFLLNLDLACYQNKDLLKMMSVLNTDFLNIRDKRYCRSFTLIFFRQIAVHQRHHQHPHHDQIGFTLPILRIHRGIRIIVVILEALIKMIVSKVAILSYPMLAQVGCHKHITVTIDRIDGMLKFFLYP